MSETLAERIARLSAGTPTQNRLADRVGRLYKAPPLDPVMATAIDPGAALASADPASLDPVVVRPPTEPRSAPAINVTAPAMKQLPAMTATAPRTKGLAPMNVTAEAPTPIERGGGNAGLAQGLATSGYSTAKGLLGLSEMYTNPTLAAARMVSGQKSKTMRTLEKSEQEMREFYRPEGTAGAVGNFTGRLLGEGAQLMVGSNAVTQAVPKLAAATGAGLGKKIVANVVPGAPLDFAIGMGETPNEGESQLAHAAKRTAYGVAGGAVLSSLGHGIEKAVGGIRDATNFTDDVVESGAKGVKAAMRGANRTQARGLEHVEQQEWEDVVDRFLAAKRAAEKAQAKLRPKQGAAAAVPPAEAVGAAPAAAPPAAAPKPVEPMVHHDHPMPTIDRLAGALGRSSDDIVNSVRTASEFPNQQKIELFTLAQQLDDSHAMDQVDIETMAREFESHPEVQIDRAMAKRALEKQAALEQEQAFTQSAKEAEARIAARAEQEAAAVKKGPPVPKKVKPNAALTKLMGEEAPAETLAERVERVSVPSTERTAEQLPRYQIKRFRERATDGRLQTRATVIDTQTGEESRSFPTWSAARRHIKNLEAGFKFEPRTAPPVETPPPAQTATPHKYNSARYPDGRTRHLKQMPDMSDEALVGEVAELQRLAVEAQQRTVYRLDENENFHDPSGRPVEVGTRGKDGISSQSKATTNIAHNEARRKLIEAELKKRGWTDEGIDDHVMKIQQEATDATEVPGGGWTPPDELEKGPVLDATGTLRGENGEALFANPIPQALRFGRQILQQHGTLAGAATGAAIGASENEDNRFKGAMVGAAAGAVAGRAAQTLLRPHSLRLAMSAGQRAALDASVRDIDFDGSIMRQLEADQRRTGAMAASVLGNRFWRFADRTGNAYGVIERLGRQAGVRPGLNARDAMTRVKQSDATVRLFERRGVIDFNTREVVGPGYNDIFEPFGNDVHALRQFMAYIKARRDIGRVALNGMAALDHDTNLYGRALAAHRAGDQIPLFQRQAAVLQQYIKGIGDYAEASGLWTPAQRAAIDASDIFYTPFQRVLTPSIDPQFHGTGGGGVVNVTGGVKRFRGSNAAIENPAVTLAQYTQNIIRRADRYQAGTAIIDNVEALGPEGLAILTPVSDTYPPVARQKAHAAANAEAWKQVGIQDEAGAAVVDAFDVKISEDNPIIWRNGPNGQREHFLVNSPELLRAATAMQPNTVKGALSIPLGALRNMKRVFTAATTGLNPRFVGLTNPLRDAVEVFAKTEANVTPADLAVGYAQSILHVVGRSDLADEAARNGLGGTSMFFHEGSPEQMARRIAPVSIADKARNALGAVSGPVRGAEFLGEASDIGPRLAEYRATLRNFQHMVDSGEWTPAELRLRAATNARGVTIDFANRPGEPTLRAFADYIPFFAVGLQAPGAFAAAAARNPARALAVTSGVGLASMLAWAVTQRSSPQTQAMIRDRPPTERAAYIIVPAGNGNVVRFPVGAELGLVHTAVTAAMDKLYTEDPNTAEMVTEALVRSLPPGIGELAQGNPAGALPIPVVQQGIEIMRNKTNYGDRPVVPKRFEKTAAAEQRLDTTAPTFDLLAAGARKLGGALGETSPLEAEHMTRGVFSSATPILTSLTDPIAEKIMGRGGAEERVPIPMLQEPLNPASVVIAKNPPAGTQSENDYYNTKDAIAKAHGAVVIARKANDIAAIPRLRHEYGVLLKPQNQQIVNAADQALRVLKNREQQATNAYRAGKLSGQAARAQLDKLRGQRQEVYRRASAILRKQGALQ